MFKPKVLVTGANGFIGGALLAKLINTPIWKDTLCLVRSEHPEDGLMRVAHTLRGHGIVDKQLLNLKLEQIICGDLNIVKKWIDDPRIPSIEKVINLAALPSFGSNPLIWTTNVFGVLNMAYGLKSRCRLKRFIQVGTAMACGHNSPNPVPEGYDGGEKAHHFVKYTQSKYECERLLKKELQDLPLVIARPSIVVGHTKYGCKASGSIYWVFRMAHALKAFPCGLDQRIDVVPVDYCADALYYLLTKSVLKFDWYHISASKKNSSSFREIDTANAIAMKRPQVEGYTQKSYREIMQMHGQFKTLLGPCNNIIISRAIKTYGNFSNLELMFDNRRLIEEGMPEPTPLAKYVGLCEKTSQDILISEQMKVDFK